MSSIQVAGHLCVDLTPDLGAAPLANPGELVTVGTMRTSAGGAVGNCGRTLATLGVATALSGSVGNDPLGRLCGDLLAALPGTTVDLKVDDQLATSYSVVVEPAGVDRSFWHHTGANDAFVGDCQIVATSLLHYGYPSLTPAMCADAGAPITNMFERAHRQQVSTSLDLAFVPENSQVRQVNWQRLLNSVLAATDVFCPSWDDLVRCLDLGAEGTDGDVERWAQQFLDWGAAIVVITMGERGSYLRTGDSARMENLGGIDLVAAQWADVSRWARAEPVPRPVTTNAAGDTYKSAFLARLSQRGDPDECLQFAGAVVARHVAGLPLAVVN